LQKPSTSTPFKAESFAPKTARASDLGRFSVGTFLTFSKVVEMAKHKGKILIETFAAEQEAACEMLEQIKHIISRADRAKSLVMIDDEDAERINGACDAVQLHLRGRRQRLASLVRI